MTFVHKDYWGHGGKDPYGEESYKSWYSYSLPMEGKSTSKPRKIPVVVDHNCPHCGSNSASLQPDYPADPTHLYCFVCGYEDSFHFKPQVQRWINWIEMQERKYGAPILLSDKEEVAQRYYTVYRKKYGQSYIGRKTREEYRAHKREYYAKNKDKFQLYNKRFRDKCKEVRKAIR